MANNLVFQEIFDGGNTGGNTGGGGSIELDTTLTQQGKAADAKATGDAIASVNKKCDAIIGKFSAGLAYTLKDDGTYEVSGIGTCTDTDIIIPSVVDGYRVTSIGYRAFRDCTSLMNVTISDSVTSIGEEAFRSCSSLTSIAIPNSVTSIGDFAFYNCRSLTSVTIPDGVASISTSAFNTCSSLTSVTIPASVTSIGNFAFYGCRSLESITIPDSVTSIGNSAFQYCYDLTSITIPDSVTSIGKQISNGCDNLRIYCEAKSKPEGWDSEWNMYLMPVIWGAALDFPSVNIQLNDCAKKEDIKDFATEGYVDAEIADAFYKIQAGRAVMTSVTYSELKTLRNNSELIPGMFYRITDYVCTTSQADTRAMDNKFDIIVQALSTSTLSENASADYHWEEGVVEGVGFKPSVVSDDTMLVEGSVIPFYYEYIDIADLESPGEYKQTDVFIAYGYLENNNGITVPVIYKTDESGLMDEPNPEFEEPDYADVFYYEGTANIDGVTYDKWRKIEQEEESELTWDSVGKAYLYTNVITDVPEGENTIKKVDGIQPNVADIPAWEIKYCLDNDTTRFAWAAGQAIVNIESSYSNGEFLTRQPAFDGQEPDGSEYQYAWGTQEDVDDGDSTNFWYSRNEVITDGEEVYSGGEIQFAQITELGKGVIYYMKDEHGNECPYDFKNIQFKRYMIVDNDVVSLSYLVGRYLGILNGKGYTIDEDDYIWCYTFSWLNENDETEDLSVIGKKLATDEGQYIGVYDNVIKTVSEHTKVYPETPQGYAIALNDVVFLAECSYDNGFFFGCYSNTFGNDCCSNTFGNICYSNTFGDACYFNTFGDNFAYNTFGNYCTYNTFGHVLNFNTFGNHFFDNILGDNCWKNTFGNDCNTNIFGNGCDSNIFGNNLDMCTFGNNFNNNTIGNECLHVRIIGDNIRNIEVGHGINRSYNYVSITPEPNADYQQIYRKSGSKEILI